MSGYFFLQNFFVLQSLFFLPRSVRKLYARPTRSINTDLGWGTHPVMGPIPVTRRFIDLVGRAYT